MPAELIDSKVYPFAVESGDDRLDLLEASEGARANLDFAPAQKLMYMLESMQPYPGDPSNVLQLHGPQFCSYQILDTEMVVMDSMIDTDEVIAIKMVWRPSFKIGMWYASMLHYAEADWVALD